MQFDTDQILKNFFNAMLNVMVCATVVWQSALKKKKGTNH